MQRHHHLSKALRNRESKWMTDLGWTKIVEGKSRLSSTSSSRTMIPPGSWPGLWLGVTKIASSGCKYLLSFREGTDPLGRHVNNVQILRWVESARIRYCESWAGKLGKKTVYDMLVCRIKSSACGMALMLYYTSAPRVPASSSKRCQSSIRRRLPIPIQWSLFSF